MKLILLLVPMVAVLTLACSAASGESGTGSPSPDWSPPGSPQADGTATSKPNPDVNDLPSSIVDPVVDEVARVARVAPTEVVVVSAEVVTFPNGGLGCPEPGMAYTQVQVDGYKVVATAVGTTYDFRGTAAGVFRRCR